MLHLSEKKKNVYNGDSHRHSSVRSSLLLPTSRDILRRQRNNQDPVDIIPDGSFGIQVYWVFDFKRNIWCHSKWTFLLSFCFQNEYLKLLQLNISTEFSQTNVWCYSNIKTDLTVGVVCGNGRLTEYGNISRPYSVEMEYGVGMPTVSRWLEKLKAKREGGQDTNIPEDWPSGNAKRRKKKPTQRKAVELIEYIKDRTRWREKHDG